jgi:hypothetical protein
MDFFGLASFYNLSLPVCAPFLILVVSTNELNGSTHGTQSTGRSSESKVFMTLQIKKSQ